MEEKWEEKQVQQESSNQQQRNLQQPYQNPDMDIKKVENLEVLDI
jgi:hypothetical protein